MFHWLVDRQALHSEISLTRLVQAPESQSQTGRRASNCSEPQLWPPKLVQLFFHFTHLHIKTVYVWHQRRAQNMLTKRSSIWLTVTALLIHCSAIKCRVMSRQFMAFESSRVAAKAAELLKIRRARFGQNTWNGPRDVLALIWPRVPFLLH